MMSVRLIILWAFFLYALLHICAGLVCRPLIAGMSRVLYSHTQVIKMHCAAVLPAGDARRFAHWMLARSVGKSIGNMKTGNGVTPCAA